MNLTPSSAARRSEHSVADSIGAYLLTATLSLMGCDQPRAQEQGGARPTVTQGFTNQYGQRQEVTVLSESAVDAIARERDTKVLIIAIEKDEHLARVQKFAHVVMLHERELKASTGLERLFIEIERADRAHTLVSAVSRDQFAERLEQGIKEYEATCKVLKESDFTAISMRKSEDYRALFESMHAMDALLIDQMHRFKNFLTGNEDWVTRSDDRTHSEPGKLANDLMKAIKMNNDGLREGIGNLTGAYGRSSEVVFAVTERYKDEPWLFNQPTPPSRYFNGTKYYLLSVSPEALGRVIKETPLDSETVPLPNYALSRSLIRPLSDSQVRGLGRLNSDGEKVFEFIVEEAGTAVITTGMEIFIELVVP